MFAYQPLQHTPNESEIRLVRLKGSPELGLRLDLQHTYLDALQYDALSYTWSTADDIQNEDEIKRLIQINGMTVQVLENLYEALAQLHRNGVTSWLWIDAICINQSDTKEKSQQVALMSNIFGKARLVHIWLGLGTPNTSVAMQLLQRPYR